MSQDLPVSSADDCSADVSVEPVFVGGTGRSGTNLLGHIIGRHSRYALIPREVAFHAAPDADGLPELLSGDVDLDRFLELMRTFWWRRSMRWDSAVERGLYKTVAEDTFQAALRAFAIAFEAEPYSASRRLMRSLLDPVAVAQGKPSWVEMTPPNVAQAPMLLRLFPHCKIVHVLRDGRDVACSVTRLPWGPPTIRGGVSFWRDGLRAAEAAVRQIPPDRVLILQLEHLVLTDRNRSYQRLLDFLEVDDEPEIRSFFESEVTPERAHLARWRVELSGFDRARTSALYWLTIRRLKSEGVRCIPRRVRLPLTPLSTTPQVTATSRHIDPWADGRGRDA